jgi:hypothetical protein
MNAWFLNQLQPSCSCPQWRRLPFRRRNSDGRRHSVMISTGRRLTLQSGSRDFLAAM